MWRIWICGSYCAPAAVGRELPVTVLPAATAVSHSVAGLTGVEAEPDVVCVRASLDGLSRCSRTAAVIRTHAGHFEPLRLFRVRSSLQKRYYYRYCNVLFCRVGRNRLRAMKLISVDHQACQRKSDRILCLYPRVKRQDHLASHR